VTGSSGHKKKTNCSQPRKKKTSAKGRKELEHSAVQEALLTAEEKRKAAVRAEAGESDREKP